MRWFRAGAAGLEPDGFGPWIDRLIEKCCAERDPESRALGGEADAAELLGVHVHTLYTWRRREWISLRVVDRAASACGRHITEFYPWALELQLTDSGRHRIRCPVCRESMLTPAPACGLCALDGGMAVAA